MIHKIIHSLHLYKNHDEFYQEGLIALWEASERFNPDKGSFANYAYTYIKGRMLSELTEARKFEERTVFPDELFWETVEDLQPLCPAILDQLGDCWQKLTANQQKWLYYTAAYDLSIREIAERENVSLSAVKNWRKGARTKLRQSWECQSGGPT